ncbi:CHAT domain-containing protein [Micromonospora sp. NPDC049366]|uniref:CHAT domain-containing protein n=1 Tax=Micromonospora sp. NPDC049366 TaxID=3364271 RepID=UPI00378C21FC
MSRVLISHAPDGAAHSSAVRDLWIMLRASGVDAHLLPSSGAVADIGSAGAVVLVGSPRYRDVASADEEHLWHVPRAIKDLVEAGDAAATAVLPVVLPAHTLHDLPDFLVEHPGPIYRLRSLGPRGVAALAADLRERCGTDGQAPRHELRLEVAVADGRLRCTATLAGTVLCERDEPLPFGRDEVWTLLEHPDAEARLAQLGLRLSAALFDPDTLDDLTTLVTKAVDGAALDVVVDADSAAHELPFELIRLADQQVLAAVDGVTVTRTVVGVAPQVLPPAPGPLKILAAVGAPEHTDNTPLDIEAEMQAIVEEVGAFGRAEVTILEVAGLDEIAEALRRDAYHVLHLSAHGSPHGVELEDADGNAVDVQAEDLVRVLRRGGRPVPLIVLSSCHGAADADTGLAMTLVKHGAARVIAMQTEISDRYATGLITRVYRALVEENVSVAAALGRARAAMFREAQDSDEYWPPEYAVAALVAATDGPLWDPDAAPEPLSNPTELPAGAGARDLLLGDLVGRRALLRTVSAVLRDQIAPDGTSSLVNGVMLTGVAGIGKTAVAGRVLTRLRDDIHDPWSIVVHSGVWDPQRLLADVAATPAGAGLAGLAEPDAAWIALSEVLRARRLLIHFDDFEHNLTGDGTDFVDAVFGEVFVALCRAASRGKIFVSGRYPVPREVPLLRVEVPVLSDAEMMRLVLRLPALRELDDDGLVLQAVGGHPRLLEFADALLRGKKGKARLPEVTERLRGLAKREGLALARSAADAPDAEEAAGQAIALAGRDMRLAELLESLTIAERETLLQAAVMWLPVSYDDLALAMHDGPPSAEDRKATGAHLDRLRDLTLLTGTPESVLMQAWLRVALDDLHGPRRTDRHRRAAAMCGHIVDSGRGTLGVLLETVRHLRAAGRFDALAALTDAVLPTIDGAQNVAGLLSAVMSVLPDDHPAYAGLLSRERDALAAAGRTAAAAEKGQELVDLTARLAEAPRRDAAAQVALSAALDGQGRLLLRLGRTGEARALYERALDIDLSLSQAEPGNATFDANLALSYEKLARLALDDAAVDQARDLVQRSLDIRCRLADADPDDLAAQRDLGACLTALAAVHHAEGDVGQARQVLEQALVLRRRAVELDPDDVALREDLFDVVGALADVLRPGGDAELVRRLAEEAAAIADELTEADGGNHLWHRKRLTACRRLGDLALVAGDVGAAGTHLTEALSVAQQLAEADPAAVEAQRDLIAAWHRMADLAVAEGRPEEVRGQLEQAVDVAQDLVARLTRHSGPHRDLAECRRRLGDWLRDRGDRAEARAMFKKAMASWRRVVSLDPQDLRAALAQAEMHGRLAELARDAGQADRARRQWREALAIAEQVHGAAPTEAHLAAVTRYRELAVR